MVVTVTVAFSLCGYCRTVSERMAENPAIKITRLTTMARTGRRMNKSVKDFISLPEIKSTVRRIFRRLRHDVVVNRHRRTVAEFEKPGAYDAITGFQSRQHAHRIAMRLSRADKLLPHDQPAAGIGGLLDD